MVQVEGMTVHNGPVSDSYSIVLHVVPLIALSQVISQILGNARCPNRSALIEDDTIPREGLDYLTILYGPPRIWR